MGGTLNNILRSSSIVWYYCSSVLRFGTVGWVLIFVPGAFVNVFGPPICLSTISADPFLQRGGAWEGFVIIIITIIFIIMFLIVFIIMFLIMFIIKTVALFFFI